MNIEELYQEIKRIQIKQIMKNDIWEIKDTKFYLPLYPVDFIARHIVDKNGFFEEDILDDLSQYVPQNAVICDIGANIGNHSLYWAIRGGARRIYAFEPVESTYEIMLKNININGLEGVILPYNIGLSDEKCMAKKKTYRIANIGDTHLEKSDVGDMRLCALDEMDISEKVDLLKIDVEDFEVFVLKGAKNLIKRYRPLIFVESYPDYFKDTESLLISYGYSLVKEYPHHNYLYRF